jgi:hypothetical protein
MKSEEFLLGFHDGFRLISCRVGKHHITQTMDYIEGRRIGREYNQKCRNFSRTESLPSEVAMSGTVLLALTNFFDENDDEKRRT